MSPSRTILSAVAAACVHAFAAPAVAAGVEMIPQIGHTAAATANARFNADGSRLYTGAGDGGIRAWDVATGMIVRSYAGHTRSVYDLAVSADENRLVSAGDDGFVVLWDARTGNVVKRFDSGLERAADVAFLPGEGSVLVRGANGRARTIDLATGAMSTPYMLGEEFTSMSFTRDASRALSIASSMTSLVVWDASNGKKLSTTTLRSRRRDREAGDVVDDGLAAATWHPDQRHAAVMTFDGNVLLIDTKSGRKVKAVKTTLPTGPNHAIQFLPDGDRVVVATSAKLQVVDLRAGTTAAAWDASEVHSAFRTSCLVESLAVSPDGARVMSSGGQCAIRLWDTQKGTPLRTLSAGQPVSGLSVAFSPDGTRLACGGGAAIEVWDLDSLSRTDIVGLRGSALIDGLAFLADGKGIVAGTNEGTPIVYDTERRQARTIFEGNEHLIHGGWELRVTPDRKKVLGNQGSSEWQLFDAATGRKLAQGARVSTCSQIASDGRHVACEAIPNTVVVDLDTGDSRTLRSRPDRGDRDRYADSIALLPDGSRILFGYRDGELEVADSSNGTTSRKLQAHDGTVASIDVSPDGRRFVTGSSDKSVKVWDLTTGNLLHTFTGHAAKVEQVRFSPNGKLVASASLDGSIRLWELARGGSVVLTGSAREWLVYDDEGHFDASPHGGDLVAAVQSRRPFRVDQLALRNNRPDLLLERVGLGSDELRAHYRARFDRRLRQIGLDASRIATAFAHPPQARIKAVRPQGKSAEVDLAFDDPESELVRYNLLVNNVPLFGAAGKPASGKSLQVTEKLELTTGSNRIEASVVGADGVESLRAFATVTVTQESKPDLYYVGFGVSRYRDRRYDLAWPHKDVLDLGEILRGMKGPFGEVHISTFVNAQATVPSVRAAKEALAGAKPDDVVVLFVAGHGVHARDADAEYYFGTHEIDPRRLSETAASFASIEELLLSTPARKRVFLMDTCESGEVDEAVAALALPDAGARGLRARSTRALVLDTTGRTTSSRSWLLQRDRYIYNDLIRRTGAIVLSSSRGSELSWERDELQNGVFTENLMRVLVDPKSGAQTGGTIELRKLQALVEKGVVAMTDGHQHPSIDRDNPELSVAFPIVAQAASIVTRDDPMPAPPAPVASAPAPLVPPVRSPPGCGCNTPGSERGVVPATLILSLMTFSLALGWHRASRRL